MATTDTAQALWEAEVNDLFRPPEVMPLTPGTVSTLHLLRREIIETLIDLGPLGGAVVPEPEAAAEAALRPHRLFASTILICTGLDLLATL